MLERVDHHDVRGHLAVGALVVVQFQPSVDVVDLAQAVLVVLPLFAFNALVGLLGLAHLWLGGGADQFDVAVQAASDALLVLELGDVLNLGHALGGVEVHGRVRQEDVVNGDELSAGALFLFVVPHLHELRATHRQLREHLLLLVAELFNLLGQLPVGVVALALGALGLLVGHFAKDLGAHRAVWRKHFFDGAGCKVDARLSHDWVDNFRGSEERSATGGVVAHASAA